MEREFQAERKREEEKLKECKENRAIRDARRRKKEKATKRALDEELEGEELENRIAELVEAYENNYSPPRKSSRSVTPSSRSRRTESKKPESKKPATRSRSTNSQPRVQESRYRDQESPEPRPGPSGLQKEVRIVRRRYSSSTDDEELEKRREAQQKADEAYARVVAEASSEDREVIFRDSEEEEEIPSAAQRYQSKGKALAKTPAK